MGGITQFPTGGVPVLARCVVVGGGASATGVITAGQTVKFDFATKLVDNAGMWNAGTPSNIVIPPNMGGQYDIFFSTRDMQNTGSGDATLCILVNGVLAARGQTAHGIGTYVGGTIYAGLTLNAGDVVSAAMMAETNNVQLTITPGPVPTGVEMRFSVTRVV